jgi:transcription elongation factor Elf1
MPWLEISVVLVIWLTVKGRRRSRRSAQGAANCLPYSRSSQPTSRRQTLPELDPDRTMHQSTCRACGVEDLVALRATRLERKPWRLVWKCESCGDMSAVRLAAVLVGPMIELDRAGGMALSIREVKDFEAADQDEFEAAVSDELL